MLQILNVIFVPDVLDLAIEDFDETTVNYANEFDADALADSIKR